MRNEILIKKLALIFVGAATLPELFDAIKLQYQMILNFFYLESTEMVLVKGSGEIGGVQQSGAIKEAYMLGLSIE